MKTLVLAALVVFCGLQANAQVPESPGQILSQQRAMEKYPSITQAGSEMNLMFLETVKYFKTVRPLIFQTDDWPMIAADYAAQTLKKQRRANR